MVDNLPRGPTVDTDTPVALPYDRPPLLPPPATYPYHKCIITHLRPGVNSHRLYRVQPPQSSALPALDPSQVLLTTFGPSESSARPGAPA